MSLGPETLVSGPTKFRKKMELPGPVLCVLLFGLSVRAENATRSIDGLDYGGQPAYSELPR